jgi:hypothetical protein
MWKYPHALSIPGFHSLSILSFDVPYACGVRAHIMLLSIQGFLSDKKEKEKRKKFQKSLLLSNTQ